MPRSKNRRRAAAPARLHAARRRIGAPMILSESTPELDAVTDADRRFFERFSDRRYRVRHMAACEIEFYHTRVNALPDPQPGMRWMIAVHQVRPGVRRRIPFQAPQAFDVDISEGSARTIYLTANEAAGSATSDVALFTPGAHT